MSEIITVLNILGAISGITLMLRGIMYVFLVDLLIGLVVAAPCLWYLL